MDELDQIRAFLALGPNLGTAGQPTPEQFPAIQRAGYEVVINLAMPTSPGAFPEEAQLVQALGMTYIALPVNWDNPTPEDVQAFFAAMAAHRDRKIFVHCALNMRVSAFVYLYRTQCLGVDPSLAKQDLHRIWVPEPHWQALIIHHEK